MAIIRGNYTFLDTRDIKGNLIDTFTEYFGEEFRETISNRLDRVIFAPYHTLEYINDYYLEYINAYQGEICYRTLDKLGIEPTPEIENILRAYGGIKDNELRDVVFYDNSLTGTVYRRIDEKKLRPIADAFGINTGDVKKDREELVRIYRTYLSAIREVENENPCDVFYDTQVIDRNHIDYTRRLLKKAEELGLHISPEDKELILRNDLEMCDLLDLDCFGSLFMDSVSYPGSISYFSSAREKELEEGSPENNIFIIQHRLQYLYKNGAEPVFFTKEEVMSDDFVYNVEHAQKDKILREYYYQIVVNRQLVPDAKAVDSLESYRTTLSKKMAHNTRINSTLQRYGLTIGDNTNNFFASSRFPEGKEKNQKVVVGMNFDPEYDDASFMEILMHEYDHAISFFNHKKVGGDKVIKTRGVTVSSLRVVDGEIREELVDTELDNLEEYCNQMQTLELTELYRQMFGLPYMPSSDITIRSRKNKFSSLYENFGFLANEFYEMFRPELKRAKVENIPLFYNYEPLRDKKTPTGIIDRFREGVKRVLTPRSPSNGKMDYESVLELARIITEYRDFSESHHMRHSIPVDYTLPLLDKLPKYQKAKMIEYIERKDKVMKKLSLDHDSVMRDRKTYEPPMVSDVFFETDSKSL